MRKSLHRAVLTLERWLEGISNRSRGKRARVVIENYDDRRAARIRELARTCALAEVPLMLVADTVEAGNDARTRNFIAPRIESGNDVPSSKTASRSLPRLP